MKVYQGLHDGEAVFIMAPAGWRMVKAKGLPDFWELRDRLGAIVALLPSVDIQELPAVQPVLGAENRT